jgi:hypothetical protein
MDKIAFYYELGYRTMLEKLAAGQRKKVKTQTETITDPTDQESLFSKAWGATKQTGTEMLDIYKKLLGIGLGEKDKYLKALAEVYGKAGLPAKILAPTLPIAALGGIGYGTYKATRKKSKAERLRELLGLD